MYAELTYSPLWLFKSVLQSFIVVSGSATINVQFCERSLAWYPEENAPSAPAPSPALWPTLNHTTVTVFTLELRRQGFLVLLVLQRHRFRPLKLCVHLVRYHPAVQHPADDCEQQETLEDPPLPPGAHPVSHGGPAPLPAVCARKPRLCCWKLRTELFFSPLRWRPLTPHYPSISTHKL